MNKLITVLALTLFITLAIVAIQKRGLDSEVNRLVEERMSEQVIIRQAKWNVEALIEQATEAGYQDGFTIGVLSQREEEPNSEQQWAYLEACIFLESNTTLQEMLTIEELNSCQEAVDY